MDWSFLTPLGIIVTLLISILSFYKSWKLTPKEIKSADVDLSKKYNDLADQTLTRAIEAEKKAREVQEVAERYEAIIAGLNETVTEHDKEIATLKAKVAEQEQELAILRKKVLSQDVEVSDLKKLLGSSKE